MPDNVFVDRNLWIYLFLVSNDAEDIAKRNRVKRLLNEYPDIVISNQVLNECSNVLFTRYGITPDRIEHYLRQLLVIAELRFLDDHNTFDALALLRNYHLSFYDALIVSTALEADCRLIFSEDMQDGQKIRERLTIINPFETKS
jgi:predicted nucleic acid-binding protein